MLPSQKVDNSDSMVAVDETMRFLWEICAAATRCQLKTASFSLLNSKTNISEANHQMSVCGN